MSGLLGEPISGPPLQRKRAKKLNDYQKFVASFKGSGKTIQEISKLWAVSKKPVKSKKKKESTDFQKFVDSFKGSGKSKKEISKLWARKKVEDEITGRVKERFVEGLTIDLPPPSKSQLDARKAIEIDLARRAASKGIAKGIFGKGKFSRGRPEFM